MLPRDSKAAQARIPERIERAISNFKFQISNEGKGKGNGKGKSNSKGKGKRAGRGPAPKSPPFKRHERRGTRKG